MYGEVQYSAGKVRCCVVKYGMGNVKWGVVESSEGSVLCCRVA
jgi:hypothetical protein